MNTLSFFIENVYFHKRYSDDDSLSPNSSKFLLSSPPSKPHALHFCLTLESKQAKRGEKQQHIHMEKDRKKENTQLESVIDKKGPLRKKWPNKEKQYVYCHH